MSKRNSDLKNRTRISGSVDTKIWDQLGQLSDKTRIPKSKLMDEAFIDLFKKYNFETDKKGDPE